jgi:serine protease Do
MITVPWNTPPALISLSFALVVTQPSIAVALNASEINQIARSVTVRVTSEKGSGSGVLIRKTDQTYTVLSAAHVFSPAADYKVITSDGQHYTLERSSIQSHPTADLAIAQFVSQKSYPVAVVAADPGTVVEGSPSYVAGFPARTIAMTESIYNFTKGEVTAAPVRPFRDGYALIYTNTTLPGMSGGPIFNADGALIGIHGRADAKAELQDQSLNPTIYVKSGVNLGIPIRSLFELLPQEKLTLATASPATSSKPSAADLSLIQDLMAQANFKLRQRDLPGAIAALDQVVRLDPNNVNAFNERGTLYLMQREFLAAILDFRQAVQLEPTFAGGYYNQGIAYLRSGSPRESYESFKKAAELYKAQGKTEQYRATLEQMKGFPKY